MFQFFVGLAKVAVQVADGVEVILRKEKLGLTIGYRPRAFGTVGKPSPALFATWLLGHFEQFLHLGTGIFDVKLRRMLSFGHFEVLHHLVVVVATNQMLIE